MGEILAICRHCRRAVTLDEFERGTALRLLGRVYCLKCAEDKIPRCKTCLKTIHSDDYEKGRALVVNGERFCEACAVRVVRRTSATTSRRLKNPQGIAAYEPGSPVPESPAEAEQRRSRRFIPPRDCRLSFKSDGLGGLFGGNRVRLWMDVSEGGGRALFTGACERGDSLAGEIQYLPRKLTLPLTVGIRHVKTSHSHPDCCLVGFSFEDPSKDLRVFLSELTSQLAELAPPREMRREPPPASTAQPA